MGLIAHLGLKAGVRLHCLIMMLVEAVCEPLEGVADAHLEGAQALGVAFQGYLYRRRIIEEVGDSYSFPLICFANQMALSLIAAYNGASQIATKPADHAIAMIVIAEQKNQNLRKIKE